jgi:hypothetical protein
MKLGARLGRRSLLAAWGAAGCAADAASLTRPLHLPPVSAPALRLLGGLEIDRAALGFGGLSGAHLDADGTLSVISDTGRFAELHLVLAPSPRLELRRAGRLLDAAARPLIGRERDAEALARVPDGWIVAFEREHRLLHMPLLGAPSRPLAPPPGLAAAPSNGGIEALAALPDGRLLALTEALPAEPPGTLRGWIGGPDRWQPIAYRPGWGLAPTDAAATEAGDLFVLERGFGLGGFTGRLVRVPAADLARPILAGEEVLRLSDPLPAENWEGLAVTPRHLLLLSDDNEHPLQRSLMLLFSRAED